MQREAVYTLAVDSPRELTKREAEDMDKRQPWRRRISSGAMDDLNALKTILLWADKLMDGEQFRQVMRELGAYKGAKVGVGMLKKAVETMLSNISAVQLRTLDANWQSTNVTISAARVVPGFVNVDVEALETLINQALFSCREGLCMASEKESRNCAVRKALDNCINAGRAIERCDGCGGFDDCPYALNRAESRAVS